MRAPPASSGLKTGSSVLFTTDDIRPHERLDAWNAAFGSLNAIALPDRDKADARVRTENWIFDGGLVLSQTSVAGAHFVRDATRVRRDQFDHWVIRVQTKGRGELRHAGFDAVTGPGDVVLFSVNDTWSINWDDVEWVSLCFPRDFDLRLSQALATMPSGPLRGAAAGLFADVLRALPARVSAAREDEIAGLLGVVHAALVGCLSSAAASAGSSPDAVASLGKERVRRAVLRNLGSARLTPAHLAAAAGMSRSALYRLFEAEGGVARYIRTMRLTLAHAALRDPTLAHKSIAAIAEEHGFPDPPEFSRAFRSAFGVTPRDVRATAGGTGLILPPPRRTIRPSAAPDVATRIYAGLR
ncbi:helix-turn-helix domain-containing protein [Alsobacter sp. R-9]